MMTPFDISNELAAKVKSLIQLDIDAVHAYAQAIDGIDPGHAGLRGQLAIFQAEHERHVVELSALLSVRGHVPPAFKRDLKGVILESMTAMRSALGTTQALKAMRQNELLMNRKYENASGIEGLPPEMVLLIRNHREDERRHLAFIEEVLAGATSSATAHP